VGLQHGLDRERRWLDMLQAAQEGLRHDPRHLSCFIYRAEAHLELGDLGAAEAATREAMRWNLAPRVAIPCSAGFFWEGVNVTLPSSVFWKRYETILMNTPPSTV